MGTVFKFEKITASERATRASERSTQFTRATQFIGRFQTAPRLKEKSCDFTFFSQAGTTTPGSV